EGVASLQDRRPLPHPPRELQPRRARDEHPLQQEDVHAALRAEPRALVGDAPIPPRPPHQAADRSHQRWDQEDAPQASQHADRSEAEPLTPQRSRPGGYPGRFCRGHEPFGVLRAYSPSASLANSSTSKSSSPSSSPSASPSSSSSSSFARIGRRRLP